MDNLKNILKEKVDGIEDDETFMTTENEVIREYCIRHQFQLDADDLAEICRRGMMDRYEEWKQEYDQVLRLYYIGDDDFHRPVYADVLGNVWKTAAPWPCSMFDAEEMLIVNGLSYSSGNTFYGEPEALLDSSKKFQVEDPTRFMMKIYTPYGEFKSALFRDDLYDLLRLYVAEYQKREQWDQRPTLWIYDGEAYIRIHDYSFSELTLDNYRKYLEERILDTDELLGSVSEEELRD